MKHRAWVLSAAGNLAVRLAGLLSAIVLARSLGPAGRGVVTEAILWPTIIVSCGAVMNVQASTFLSARYGTRGARASLQLALLAGLVLLPLSLATNWLVLGARDKASFASANLYAVIIPITMLANAFAGSLLARDRVAEFWTSRALPGLLTATATVALAAAAGLSPIAFVWASVLSAGITLVWMTWRQRATIGDLRSHPGSLRVEALQYGGTIAMVMLPYQLNLRLDQLLLSLMSTEQALGLYAVATAWSSMLSVVGSGFSTVVLAHSARVEERDEASTAMLFRKVRLAMSLVVIAGVVAAVAAPLGIPLLYGSAFKGAIAPALVLCAASVPLYINIVLHDFTRGLGHPEVGIVPEVAGLVVNVGFLVTLVPRFGPLGAAIASLISYTLVCLIMMPRIVAKVPGSTLAMLLPSAADMRDLRGSLIATMARLVPGIRGS